MKKFLTTLSIFVAILLVGATVLDAFISYRLRQSELPMFRSWRGVYLDDTDYDIVINGGSRAFVQYDPAIIDSVLGTKTYNMGIDGSAINRQILKYEAYCRTHKHAPKLLIQNIDFVTLQLTQDFDREQFFPYAWNDRKLFDDISRHETYTIYDRYLPLVRYFGYHALLQSEPFKPYAATARPYNGYTPQEREWDGSLFAQQESIGLSKVPEACQLFDDFIGRVKQSGTQVILVYAPVYCEVNTRMHNLQEMYDLFEGIAQKYDVPILNYNEIAMTQDTAYFYNALHMNKRGAEKFTRIFADDLKEFVAKQ